MKSKKGVILELVSLPATLNIPGILAYKVLSHSFLSSIDGNENDSHYYSSSSPPPPYLSEQQGGYTSLVQLTWMVEGGE